MLAQHLFAVPAKYVALYVFDVCNITASSTPLGLLQGWDALLPVSTAKMRVSCYGQEIAVLKILFFPAQSADSTRHKSLIPPVELPYNCNVIYAHAGGLVNKKQRDEIVAKFTKKFGNNRMVMLGSMILEYSLAQNKCDI